MRIDLGNNLAITSLLLGLVFVLAASSSVAQAQIPAADRQALIDLYHSTGGDDWANNDGWLGEPGSECDWFGVDCSDVEGRYSLVLFNNNLDGPLPDSFGNASGMQGFLASRNRISGSLSLSAGQWPQVWILFLDDNLITGIDFETGAANRLGIMSLSDNLLEGQMPDGLQARGFLRELNLSNNQLSGDLPGWLGGLSLNKLYLSNNGFTGSIEPALAAMKPGLLQGDPLDSFGGVLLGLDSNSFSGEVGSEMLAYRQDIDGWLNLCWNNLQVTDSAVVAWLQSEHFRGEFEHCFDLGLQPPPLTSSGSWYNPQRAGEGMSVMQLEDGQTLVHYFTYAPTVTPPRRQIWLSGNRVIDRPGLDDMQLESPAGGSFGSGLPDPNNYPIDFLLQVRLAWTEEGVYSSSQALDAPAIQDPIEQVVDLVQLSQLAGTSCDNQSAYQNYSGAWFNPDRSGEGFVIEVMPDDRVVVYWFTYTPDQSGLQAWMIGDSRFANEESGAGSSSAQTDRIDMTLFQTSGGAFGQDFDPNSVNLFEWGQLDIEFSDDDTAHIYWDGPPEYGTGDYPIERFARAKLAECDE